ncbi:amino acid ABC transporter permease [Candidatus Bipolaricaulota bacterium]|jgi:polar amino acid transport system permease protein|nr:amino acid ABC transporter permease [Candidatus Bipolaricaulota bacterium]TFH10529.1 MAG: amino acid ABC transporter permease [Candidatus Atribacteria bacterium]
MSSRGGAPIQYIVRLGPYIPNLLRATVINIELLIGLIAVGYVFGTLVALLQVYGGRALCTVARIYEWIFRSIPALVLIFLFYFGPPRFGVNVTGFTAAMFALGFRSSAYQSQIFRGAIQSVPTGQMMAARSMGMSRIRAIFTIILPQAFRLSIPGWTNEFSSVIKDTTLAYAAGFNEVLRTARIVYDTDMTLAMAVLVFVALIFMVLTLLGNAAMGFVERRFRIPGLEVPGHEKARQMSLGSSGRGRG